MWISLGAVVGANLRWLTSRAMSYWLGPAFPWGTLLVNVAGCLLVGLVGGMVTARLVARPEVVRQLVIVGFLGSLTTFSAFAYETDGMMRDGEWLRATLYLLLSVAAGLAGARLGLELAALGAPR